MFSADNHEFILPSGESFLVKRGVAHGFRAINCDEASVLASSRNEGRMERYVTNMVHYFKTKQMTPKNMEALTLSCDQQRTDGIHEYVDHDIYFNSNE